MEGREGGLILPIILMVMVLMSLLCLHMLDSAVLDQRLSAGFLSSVKIDQAAVAALKQGEWSIKNGQGDTHGEWVSLETNRGILSAYQLTPQGNVVLIQTRAGNAQDPDQVEWQAYWAGGEQSCRRVK